MFGFFSKKRRRKQLLDEPLPGEWRAVIERNVAVFSLLPSAEQSRLIDAVKIIVAERPFVGSGGMVISDEVKVTIAAQAALLLLGEEGYYFDRVPTIFVYPHFQTAKAAHSLQGGWQAAVLVEEGVAVKGQVLEQGEIRLAWDEVLYGGQDPADGENVVLHEFAHHLDRLDGDVDGIPPLSNAELRRRWPEVFDHELNTLRRDLRAGREVFLHEEAADSRTELFAYSTECFFEQPLDLEELHPELFECLRGFYRIDPRAWFEDGVTERGREGEN
jgi:Mlc titration factor MtfA (ptsG expression regulator)